MNDLEKRILECINKDYIYLEDDITFWILYLSVFKFNEDFNQPIFNPTSDLPTHIARVVYRFENKDGILEELVDGHNRYFIVEGDKITEIWKEVWEGDTPAFYGGTVDEALVWCNEYNEVCYIQEENPNKKGGIK